MIDTRGAAQSHRTMSITECNRGGFLWALPPASVYIRPRILASPLPLQEGINNPIGIVYKTSLIKVAYFSLKC